MTKCAKSPGYAAEGQRGKVRIYEKEGDGWEEEEEKEEKDQEAEEEG